MAVEVKAKFTKEQLTQLITVKLQKAETIIIAYFRRVGEQFITDARTNGEYTDRTGNLRNSIGYILLKNGEQLFSNFEKTAVVSEQSELDGVAIARKYAEGLIPNFPNGIVLIVVAGMDYAAAVESKGYDVLTASSKTAKQNLKKSIKTVREKIGKL
jgi:hypothetical protein